MTRDQAREFAKVVQAYADGKRVQFFTDEGWIDATSNTASLNSSAQWRVKPEPREWWIVVVKGGRVTGTFEKCEDAEFVQRAYPISSIVNVREVM